MIVDEISGEAENFPVGMRVLAVDDDPICLKLLDSLLRKCQYRVTTTCQARVALKMLRENKDQFDLVISDVHMPDMDGFKLLELVGIEMDLPVIMLSANSDPKLVMEGVTHGACDYLVKPVRIEELRNIWQHVVRRKNFDAKTQNKSGCQDNNHRATDRQESSLTGNSDHNGKFNRKRKDEEEESEDNGNESEDPATQKKPRVVWSVDLHRKFVAAVNQLGIDKAVPKRILDLMNVDGLTRENVASHLQKYRLYLRRISSVATQQTNMAAGIRVKDSPFMHMGSLDTLGGISAGARHANVGLPFTTSMLSRLNSAANVNLRSLASSALVQESRAQNSSNSISSLGKMHPLLSPPSQNASSFQGIPSALELDQFQQNWGATVDNSRLISNVGMFANSGTAIGSSSNLLNNASNNGIMQNGKTQQAFSGGGLGDQSARTMASFTSGSFNGGVSTLSSSLDPGKYNVNWQNNTESSKMPPNPSHSCGPFRGQLPLNGWRDNSSSNGPYVHNSVVELTSSMALLPFEDSREIQCQEELVGDLQNMHQAPGQRSRENGPNYAHGSNNTFVSLASPIPPSGTVSPLGHGSVRNSTIFNQKMDTFTNGRSSASASTLVQKNENGLSATESRERSNEDFLLEQPKRQSGFVPLYDSSLDALVNARIKREQGETIPACDFGLDDYPFGPGV